MTEGARRSARSADNATKSCGGAGGFVYRVLTLTVEPLLLSSLSCVLALHVNEPPKQRAAMTVTNSRFRQWRGVFYIRGPLQIQHPHPRSLPQPGVVCGAPQQRGGRR